MPQLQFIPRPQRLLLLHHPNHRLDLAIAPRVYQVFTSMRPKAVSEVPSAPLPLPPPPNPSNTPPSPHWLYDLQDTLDDKLIHSLTQLSDFVTLKTAL